MTAETPWRRLSVRVVYVDLIRLLVSAVPGYLGGVVLNDDGPVWPLVAASAFGALGALLDFKRWLTSRYRVTAERVEIRSGWLVRRHRSVPRDRIRSVNTTAKLFQRLMSVRVVHVGSGESGSSFQLDALSTEAAEILQTELLAAAAPPETTDTEPVAALPEVVLARFQRRWIAYNAVTVWAVLNVAGPLFGAYWFLQPFGVDLLDAARAVFTWSPLPTAGTIVVGVFLAYLVGAAGMGVAFALENWRFTLARAGTPPHTTLVTRRGLLSTQTVQRDDRRMRGIAFREPVLWRWLRLAETQVITTGLGSPIEGASSAAAKVLPRLPLSEARPLAARILPDGSRPLESPLRRHPRSALTRRLFRAVAGPAAACAVLYLFIVSGAVPERWWWLPLTSIPVTLPLAVSAYFSLGHTVTGDYVVARSGPLNRTTVALRSTAVIGWSLEQSLFQRLAGRIDVTVPTAAGDRHYVIADAGVTQALSLIEQATPGLAAQFLTPTPLPPPAPPALPPPALLQTERPQSTPAAVSVARAAPESRPSAAPSESEISTRDPKPNGAA